jgi:hypothetical protein
MTVIEILYVDGSGLFWFKRDMERFQQILDQQNIKYSFERKQYPLRGCFNFENPSDAILFKLRYANVSS